MIDGFSLTAFYFVIFDHVVGKALGQLRFINLGSASMQIDLHTRVFIVIEPATVVFIVIGVPFLALHLRFVERNND